jgi:hypothetical protein
MSAITISFPGGAGGNWLSNLVNKLESIDHTPQTVEKNYHSHTKSANILLTHSVSDKSVIFLNGQGLFNIYLNVVDKLRIHQQHILEATNVTSYLDLLASEASSKLFFLEERTDLSWDDIFVNPTRFIQTLYSILDQYNINYTKNNTVCLDAINEYKTTCTNPLEHYDNFDSVHWLGWGNGICKHLYGDWPLVNSQNEMKEFLLPRRQFFKEYTKQFII